MWWPFTCQDIMLLFLLWIFRTSQKCYCNHKRLYHYIILTKLLYWQKRLNFITFYFRVYVLCSFLFLKIIIIDIDCYDISGYTIATEYLRNLQISEAEMTQYLCNIKMSATNTLTKKYRVPYFPYMLKDKTVQKYLNRPASFRSLNLTQYIR